MICSSLTATKSRFFFRVAKTWLGLTPCIPALSRLQISSNWLPSMLVRGDPREFPFPNPLLLGTAALINLVIRSASRVGSTDTRVVPSTSLRTMTPA